MNKLTTGLTALTIVFAAAVAAQTSGINPATNPGSSKVAPMQYSALDTNKDGKVSRDEVKSHAELTSSFGTLDTDHDTYLSETEYGKWSMAPGAGTAPGVNKTPPSAMPPAK